MDEKKQLENEQKDISKKSKIKRTVITVGIIVLVVLAAYLALKFTGILDKLENEEQLKDIILSGGGWSYAIFMILQFLQVTFLPLPAMVTTLVGTWIFGPWETVFMSIAAIMAGRVFAFFLGRKFGTPLVKWMVGEKDAAKWSAVLERGKYTYFLMLVFPFFPDDVLCLIAGITKITWRFYLIANFIAVVITTFAMCFIGSGQIIPFSGWGIPVWIVLVILLVAAIILSFKYKDKIESFVTDLGEKLSNKDKKKDENDK